MSNRQGYSIHCLSPLASVSALPTLLPLLFVVLHLTSSRPRAANNTGACLQLILAPIHKISPLLRSLNQDAVPIQLCRQRTAVLPRLPFQALHRNKRPKYNTASPCISAWL